MPEKRLQIKEAPAFTAQKENYQKWRDFCEGGDRIEKNDKYLPQHPYESDAQYKIRKVLATYKNHAKPIVTVFTSSVWRKKPVRKDLPEDMESFKKDIDNLGTSADMFFKTADQKAAEEGLCFILVDATKAPEGAEIKTQKDSKKHNIRPYLVPVSVLSVISWGFDENGLSFVVIKEEQEILTSPFSDSKKEKKYKIWYRDRWEEYIEDEESGLVLGLSDSHPCGEVPLVPVYYKKKTEMVGESAIADIVSILSRAYNLENSLDKSLFDTAFPLQAFYGFDEEQIKAFIRSSSNGIANPSSDAKSEFVEPAGKAFEALDRKIKNDEVSIREIALRMIRPDSKVGESADSKRIDNQQLHSQLSVFSQNCEDAEVKCWKLIRKWSNEKDLDFEIEYNKDFDIEKVTGDLLRAFSEMRRNKDISRKTFLKALMRMEFPFPEDFDLDEELDLIESDFRSSGSMGELGEQFLTKTG